MKFGLGPFPAVSAQDVPIDVGNKHFAYTGIEAPARPIQQRPLMYFDGPDLLRADAAAGVDAAIVGDPATVGEEITKLRDAGFTYVQPRFRFDSQPAEPIHGALELFASDVMPAFAD